MAHTLALKIPINYRLQKTMLLTNFNKKINLLAKEEEMEAKYFKSSLAAAKNMFLSLT